MPNIFPLVGGVVQYLSEYYSKALLQTEVILLHQFIWPLFAGSEEGFLIMVVAVAPLRVFWTHTLGGIVKKSASSEYGRWPNIVFRSSCNSFPVGNSNPIPIWA